MLESQEPERGQPELGEQGWRALMARADILIEKMAEIEAQILALFED
jgi:hypothetical protein